MIRLEQVIEILKKDNNFREISSAGEYYFNWPKEVNFDQLSYDSRKSTENTLFFAFCSTYSTVCVCNNCSFHSLNTPEIISSSVHHYTLLLCVSK